MPAYNVATLVEKSGKSRAHVYARLSLLQLTLAIDEAFRAERITASHANLLARLHQDVQDNAISSAGVWRLKRLFRLRPDRLTGELRLRLAWGRWKL